MNNFQNVLNIDQVEYRFVLSGSIQGQVSLYDLNKSNEYTEGVIRALYALSSNSDANKTRYYLT